ncbi:MAG: hypothetical protein QOD39_1941 [Mycobacterium sp.]|jgi:uncharacterized protein (TIGR03083 family)|nr:hypothetical protein [Mycobacterium sp.]
MKELPQAMDLLLTAAEVASRSIDAAAQADPASQTPCTEWDLATLIRHLADSALVLRQLLDGTMPELPPPAGCAAAQHELARLRDAVDRAPRSVPSLDLAALAGSYELTVHAWDINRTTRNNECLPRDLVSSLLELAPLVLDDIDRTGLFAAPLPPGSERSDEERLLALFGRRDRQSPPTQADPPIEPTRTPHI